MTNDARGSAEPTSTEDLLNNTMGMLQKLTEARSNRRDALSETVEKLTERNAALAKAVRQRDERISEIQGEMKAQGESHAAEIERRSQERAAAERKLTDEVKSLKSTVATLTSHVETLEKTDQALRDDLATAQRNLDEIEARMAQVQADYEALDRESKSKIQRAMTTAEQGARRLKLAHSEKLEEMQSQIKTLNLELGESRSSNKALRDENGRLSTLVRSMQKSIENLLESEMSASEVARELREQAGTGSTPLSGIQEQVSQGQFRKSAVPLSQFKTEA